MLQRRAPKRVGQLPGLSNGRQPAHTLPAACSREDQLPSLLQAPTPFQTAALHFGTAQRGRRRHQRTRAVAPDMRPPQLLAAAAAALCCLWGAAGHSTLTCAGQSSRSLAPMQAQCSRLCMLQGCPASFCKSPLRIARPARRCFSARPPVHLPAPPAIPDYRPQGDLHSSPADSNCFARPRGYKKAVIDTGNVACLVYRCSGAFLGGLQPAAMLAWAVQSIRAAQAARAAHAR